MPDSISHRTPPCRVIAIAGSLRRDSINRLLLRAAAEMAPTDLQVDVYDGLTAIPMFDEDSEKFMTATGPVRALAAQVSAADAVLIATPEYNHSIPGVLKNAIDWLSRGSIGDVLAGKPVAVIGASTGRWGTRLAQTALRQVLFATGSVVLSGPAVYLNNGAAAFDAQGRLIDPATRASLGHVLDMMRRASVTH
ncbi:NADPH-dependent FMN reductase [Dyella tabacisoli]|uniref:NAD(P)H-dependent oxidoreductase n=1 Tax=Dyella tabacisoli TaxID=2282381 RepID=A0A369UUV3_9GAMM|nr:NAD(P)H-dependent oxidoreductase [Dyella tabacisoli]RDD82129.1 NAD(P)H-dependent oxidoreductase [Dyella tabacisoli]